MFDIKRWLIFVLEEDIAFSELILKLEQVFDISLPCKDDKGRYIAKAELKNCCIEVIDRIDRLGDFLCDENHVLQFVITNDDFFTSEFEGAKKRILDANKVMWSSTVWAPNDLH
jgi:hypothetical protein